VSPHSLRDYQSDTSAFRPYLLLSPSASEEFTDCAEESGYDSVILGLHEESLAYGPLNKAFRILKREPVDPDPSITGDSSSSTPSPPASSGRKSGCSNPTLIAPHASLYHQASATQALPAGLSLGIGPFVRALELASGVEAEMVGKPTRRFFELAIERMEGIHTEVGELKEEEIGVVGDDVVNDLGEGARELGLKRILGKRVDEHCPACLSESALSNN
jgi:ribonucleotide monophosphatase NagD (HAD superfamily)